MSRGRSNSLGDLPSRTTLSHDQEIPFLSQRAGTEITRAGPLGQNAFFAAAATRSGAQTRGVEQQREDIETRRNNLEVPARWKKLNLLTCDGGGIRGYASALMIKALMEEIGKIERDLPEKHLTSFEPHNKPKLKSIGNTGYDGYDDGSYASAYLPCHYFDYMMGTSTGGLIAIMLSRWRMSIGECLRQYEDIGRDIFRHPRKFGFFGLLHDKYDEGPLERAIVQLTTLKTPEQPHGSRQRFDMFPSPSDLCRTAVLAREEEMNRASSGLYVFRSYETEAFGGEDDFLHNSAMSIDHEILKVCRATTAAPTYFPPLVIGGNRKFSDGGVEYNNPTFEAIKEIRVLHGHESLKQVVSFGTGKPARESRITHGAKKKLRNIDVKTVNVLNDLGRIAKGKLTDCEQTHKHVEEFAKHGVSFEYSRFNVERGLGKMKIDEHKATTLQTIINATRTELNNTKVQNKIRLLAQDLVTQRRERIRRYPSQWERFVLCTTYECDEDRCRDEETGSLTRRTRDEMRDHLRNFHEVAGEIDEARLDLCRRNPDFPVGPW